MKEIDIASFAENLVAEEITKGKPVQFSAPQSTDAPDVSDIEVPSNFTSQVLTEGHWDKAHVNVEDHIFEENKEELKSTRREIITINEESAFKQHILNEYKKKVSDLEELVELMENLGMVGTGVTSIGPGPMGDNPQTAKKTKRRRNVRTTRFNR